jgi:hypothetical protein
MLRRRRTGRAFEFSTASRKGWFFMKRPRAALLRAALAIAVVLVPAPSLARDFAYLSDKQLADLRALGIPVVLPAELPPGYALARFDLDRDAKEYVLHFRGPAHRSIFVSVSVSEFGDAAPDYTTFRRSFDADSPVLGKAHFEPVDSMGTWTWAATYIPLDRSHPASPQMNIGGDSTSDLKAVYAALRPLPKR